MTLALYGKSRKRRGALLLTAFLAVLAATIGGLALIGTAFAHAAIITGTSSCNSDGTWTVKWTVSNDWTEAVTLSSIAVNNGATTPSLTPNPIPASPSFDHPETYNTATGTSVVPGSASSVTLSLQATWSGDNFVQDPPPSGTVNRPAGGCTRIIQVQKMLTEKPASTTTFTGTVSPGTVGNTTFSLSIDNTHKASSAASLTVAKGVAQTVTEDTPPTGWTLVGYKIAPSNGSCSTTPSDYSLTSNVVAADNNGYLVCIMNKPARFITISDNACTANVAGSGTWHFVAPNTTKGSGGLLTVTYHFNGESVGAHTTTQVEDTGSHSNAQWFVNIAFGSHTSITIDSVTDANGDTWNGVNGANYATMQSSSCPSATGTLKVYKLITNLPNGVTVGNNFTGTLGSYNWSAAVNGTAWTQSGATPGAYTVAETGSPTTASDGGTISLVGYAPPTVGSLTCPTDPAAYGTDAAHITQTLAAQGTSVFCVLNVYKAPEVVTQQVTFIKYICPDAAAVPNTDQSSNPVKPDLGGCVLATTAWTFDLSVYGSSTSLGSVTTASNGSATIAVAPS